MGKRESTENKPNIIDPHKLLKKFWTSVTWKFWGAVIMLVGGIGIWISALVLHKAVAKYWIGVSTLVLLIGFLIREFGDRRGCEEGFFELPPSMFPAVYHAFRPCFNEIRLLYSVDGYFKNLPVETVKTLSQIPSIGSIKKFEGDPYRVKEVRPISLSLKRLDVAIILSPNTPEVKEKLEKQLKEIYKNLKALPENEIYEKLDISSVKNRERENNV